MCVHDIVHFPPLQCTAPCGDPRNFSVNREGLSSVVLSWNEVECSKTNGLILWYHACIIQDIESKCINSSRFSEVIFGLSPFVKYTFTVAAWNEAGLGPHAIHEGCYSIYVACATYTT